MLKPRVGLILLVSSPLMRFTIVVLPALSNPLQHTKKRFHRRHTPCFHAAAPTKMKKLNNVINL
jgi:hypothetical protein